MIDFLTNVIGTIIGGLILTFVLFYLNEYVFLKQNLTGEWETIISIEKTSFRKFINLKIEYKLQLLQKGYEIVGFGEKIKDIYPDGKEYEFEPQKRTRLEVNGYFERKYLGKSKIHIVIEERGRVRETSATYFLTISNNTELKGKFISTAANSRGSVKMVRNPALSKDDGNEF